MYTIPRIRMAKLTLFQEVSTLGFIKEVGQAALMGSVAQTGVTRELSEADIAKERA